MKAASYLKGIQNGDISILSQAITLIESTIEKDKKTATILIDLCLQKKRNSKKICISGPPGVGKSTFINKLGTYLIKNKKIAVLAIDPSSQKSKGSILADKTRMHPLSNHPNSFIRPSPNKGVLGGINKTTRESIILCETFGFDIIIIETVGVGQSEIIGHSISDCFILLTLPKSGDQIQAIKKGILEIADIIIIHKSDTINKLEIKKEKNNYSERFNQEKIIEEFSSLSNENIENIWIKIECFLNQKTRNNKQLYWLNEAIKEELELVFFQNKKVKNELKIIKKNIKLSNLNLKKLAKKLVKKYLK